MKLPIARLGLLVGSVLLGGVSYAAISFLVAFAGCLALQTTSSRFEVDVPKRFSDVNFFNGRFARYSSVYASALLGLTCAVATFRSAGSFGAALMAAFGGTALATAIIFLKPDILRREEKSL